MFGLELAMVQIWATYYQQRLDNYVDEMAREHLSGTDYMVWAAKMREEKERQRQEEVAERRHRELCEAIRSTGFRRF